MSKNVEQCKIFYNDTVLKYKTKFYKNIFIHLRGFEMKILVIGNGFDLAHGLPTKYTDFLDFVKVIRQIIYKNDRDDMINIKWGNMGKQLKNIVKKNINESVFVNTRLVWINIFVDNVWIDYFLHCEMHMKENWIDFESEISNVIRSIDCDMKKYKADANTEVKKIKNIFFAAYFLENKRSENKESLNVKC